MPELFMGKIPIVNRSLNEGWIRAEPPAVSTGLVDRDFSIDPVEMRDSPDGMKLYARSEWDAVYDEQVKNESSLLHLFLRGDKPAFQFLDQDGFPDCWYHGPAHAYMLACMRDGEPIPRINGVAGATLCGRTNGGWSGLAMKDMRDNGAPIMGSGEGEWPMHTRNKKYNTAEFKANRQKHKVLEDWYDLGKEVYDQELSKDQLFFCSANNNPGSIDFNRYAHAMGFVCVVRIESGSWGPVVLNSWEQFGFHGLAVLREIWPDGAVALRSAH
jgi:hypothetical protein